MNRLHRWLLRIWNRIRGRRSFVVVASFDHPAYWDKADYICDGIDDQVEIQAAIDYVEAMGGGIVVMTPGRFNQSTGIKTASGVKLRGSRANDDRRKEDE